MTPIRNDPGRVRSPHADVSRGGHSHTRNAFGRNRGHKVVTETLAIFLVVTGSVTLYLDPHNIRSGRNKYFR